MFDKVLNTPLFNIGQLHFLKKYNEDLSVLETNMETISNCHYIETSQPIGRVFQLTNFYGIAFAGKTSYSIKRRRSLCDIFWDFAKWREKLMYQSFLLAIISSVSQIENRWII